MNTTQKTRSGRLNGWARWAAASAAIASIGLGATACAQTAVPAGPPSGPVASPSPSDGSPSPSTRPSAKSPKPKAPKPSKPSTSATEKTSPTSSPSATAPSKPAPPVRPKGNVHQHSSTHKVTYKKRVSLKATAKFADGVQVSVTGVRAIKATPVGPGEIGGPALALVVRIRNAGTAPIDLSTASVVLQGSDGSPGIMSSGKPSAPLSGSLKPGQAAKGTYVFTIDKKLRRPITVQVQYGAGQTVLQFSGNA